MGRVKTPLTLLVTPEESDAVPTKGSAAIVKSGPSSVRMMGEAPPRGEHDWPIDMPVVHATPVPGPKSVRVTLRLGSLGKETGTPPSTKVIGVIWSPSLMTI